ncbi:outer membrane adhesin-like protein [Thauera phenylacetica B4P]|uniref:Outer membrane adhesin-like protein n=1 Tax=Thauera phenylacetica B4P TaxID=1234382 RepID=N6Z9H9_9RHOO|nr:outer membrane adhesin-like protein [Thauera phenylacetica B4P]
MPASVFPFADADGDGLAGVTITALPQHGSLLLEGVAVQAGAFIPAAALSGLVYAPAPDYHGPDGFGFKVWDDSGAGGGAGLSSAEQQARITVTPVPDAPVSADLPPASDPARLTVEEDARLALPASVFPFADADGDGLAGVTITALPQHGRLLLEGVAVQAGVFIPAAALSGLVYAPAPDYHGPDGFGFKVWDDSGADGGAGLSSAEQQARITVTPLPDAPVSADLPPASDPARLTVEEDARLALPASVFPFADADGDGLAGVTITALPQHGRLLLEGVAVQAGVFIPAAALSGLVYAPAPDYHGPDGFGFKVWDDSGADGGAGLSSAEQQARITVTPVDDPEPVLAVFATTREPDARIEREVPTTPPLAYWAGFRYDVIQYEVLLEPFSYPEVDTGGDAEPFLAISEAFQTCTLHPLLGIGCRFVPPVVEGDYLASAGRGALAYASPDAPGLPPAELRHDGTFASAPDAPEAGFNSPFVDAYPHTLADSEFAGVEPGEVELPAGAVVVPQSPEPLRPSPVETDRR